MDRNLVLAAGVALVVLVSAVGMVAVPGVLAAPQQDPEPPSRLAVSDLAIGTGAVTGETATLRVETRLKHRGGAADNVTLRVRAVDAASGLVETERTVAVGTVDGDRERAVTANITVPRSGDYRVESIVYQNERRIVETRRSVSGVGSLQPAFAESDLQFHRFDGPMPAVEFEIAASDDDRTTLAVDALLTNTGDDVVGDVELLVKARQVDSGIVADRSTVDVSEVRPGRTATASLDLTVPTQYNYYLDAVLLRDGVVVDTVRAPAALDPTKTIPMNQTTTDTGLQVSDFDSDEPTDDRPARTQSYESDGQGPGFGVVVALVAVLGTALLARRRSA
ncbi:PGF-CTERM sorting domain-containing protein [Halomarina salina]|uniref:PGF-CTERM sorting domain-containing protein n=1 Tax=Halomarina salina TaxID=1872699 RepID=A0ABD5RIW3_9EURY|nr:PGF-CTERM sorting domain-containing protein [Halomarina salina]